MSKVALPCKGVRGDMRDRDSAIPKLGFTEDDVRRQLRKTAREGVCQIKFALEGQFDLSELPSVLEGRLQAKAIRIYIQYCQQLIRDLEASAENPKLKI